MTFYIITCPVCRKQFKLMPKDPMSLAHKSFSCPNCRYTAPFHTLIKDLPCQSNITISTETDVSHYNNAKTKVSPNLMKQSKAYLSVLGSNARFVLSQGVYVLGRKSSDSSATLQLAPDISMSRQHARLTVQVVGGKLMAQIIGLKANNPIVVNGRMFAAGQPCTLKSGDKLQLGMTKLVFTI